MKILIPILIVLCLFSCRYERKDNHHVKEIDIEFKNTNLSDTIGRVLSIKAKENRLLINHRFGDSQLLLVDIKDNGIYGFGQVGEGPGRVLGCWSLMLNKQGVEVYDIRKNRILGFVIDSIINSENNLSNEVTSRLPMQYLDMTKINDSTYIALGLLGKNRFAIFDKKATILYEGGSLPPKKNEQISDIVHSTAYQGVITSSETKKRIAIGTRYAGQIQLYDLSDQDNIILLKDNTLFLADYEQTGAGGNSNFSINPETRLGYLSIDSNDEYIYALYSGKYQINSDDFFLGNEIHVFNWNGEMVCKLKTERKMSLICVDNTYLYGYENKSEDIIICAVDEINL